MSLIRWICRLHDVLTDASYIVGTVGLAAMATLYCYEVLTRYFLGSASDWTNDTFSNLLLVTIFSMAPHATRMGMHLSINLIVEAVPRFEAPLKVFSGIAGFVICLFVAWMSFEENIRQIVLEIVTYQNRPIPKVWISSFITYGFVGSSFYFLRGLFRADAVRPVSWIVPGSLGKG